MLTLTPSAHLFEFIMHVPQKQLHLKALREIEPANMIKILPKVWLAKHFKETFVGEKKIEEKAILHQVQANVLNFAGIKHTRHTDETQ